MENETIRQFIEYRDKTGDRKALYKAVATEFSVKSAAYPGSFIDISPSLVIPEVTYIDNFKGAVKFFRDIDSIKEYIEANKEYTEQTHIDFIGQDYTDPMNIDKVDLIISQYAGFVGQATKYLLKKGGILLCNDSHGDATLAKHDEYEFIGVVNNSNVIVRKDLDKYFRLPGGKPVDIEKVKQSMKGPKYTSSAANYLFLKK
ncbi:MAG TPA: hypothetical protein PLP30_09700 [Clostridia bacterium]|nr:hypothetical protein [Clostridia bacterium]HPQ47632.1 hypothetical protein [Clostridia bacterium]HRX42724.1 hypothetical protein [Clostridia bacterium]